MEAVAQAGDRARKTAAMLRVEEEFGRDIRDVIIDTYNRTGNLETAARVLDINAATLYGWMLRLGITIDVTRRAVSLGDGALHT